MKAIATIVTAFGLCGAALAGGCLVGPARAQEATAAPVAASPSPVAKHRVRRARSSGVRTAASRGSAAQGAGNLDSARGQARRQGAVAAPPKTALPAGTLDLGNGLTFLLNYTSQSAANPIGGIRQGADYTAQVFLGVDGDLERLAGIEGGSFHVILTQRHGRSISRDFIGNDTSVQEIYGGGQTHRLTQMVYQQKLFDNHLDIEIGRLNAQAGFLTSPIYCNFQNNATCGSPTFTFKNTNFTYFPTSSWGADAKVWLDEEYKYFVRVGAYEVNPNRFADDDHGFDWSTKGATGAVVPIELGYSTTFANDLMPRNYGIGAVIDRSDYKDPIRDVAGGRFIFSGLDPLTRFGRSLVFARFDQMIWRPDPNEARGLTLFGVAMKATGGEQVQDYFLELGLLQTGTFADRPYDTIGFVVSDQKYSADGLSNIRAARASLGLDPRGIPTSQIMMELNYGIQLNPAARLTPQIQYIVNPDQTRFPFRPKPIPDAFVVGAKFSCDLFTLFGLAKGPGSL